MLAQFSTLYAHHISKYITSRYLLLIYVTYLNICKLICARKQSMDLKKQFSFLKHFNEIKGVGKAVKAGEFDTEWLDDPKMRERKEKYD